MDLLRFVLSHQTLESLMRFPGLVRSDQFSICRSNVRGYKPTSLGVLVDSAKNGEVSSICEVHVDAVCVLDRAVFLRQVEHIINFVDRVKSLDFWLLLESDILEAQAKALAALIYHHEGPIDHCQVGDKALYLFNDLNVINWTPRLIRILRYLLGQMGKWELTGFLRACGRNISVEGYIGMCWRALGGEETTEEYPELDVAYKSIISPDSRALKEAGIVSKESIMSNLARYIMISGYITPYVAYLKEAAKDSPAYPDIVKMALKYVSHLSLKIIAESEMGREMLREPKLYLPKNQVITRWYRKRVESILRDPALVKLLPENTIDWYRAVVGEYFDTSKLPQIVYLGAWQGKDFVMDIPYYSSLQGISFYDPKAARDGIIAMGYVYEKSTFNPLIRDGYRKGKFVPECQVKEGRTSSVAPEELYNRVLAYLKGETETWDPNLRSDYPTVAILRETLYISRVKFTDVRDTISDIRDGEFWSLTGDGKDYTLVSTKKQKNSDPERVRLVVRQIPGSDVPNILGRICALLELGGIVVHVLSDSCSTNILISPRSLHSAVSILEADYNIE